MLDIKRLLAEVAALPDQELEELQSLIREHFPDTGNSSRSPVPEGVDTPISAEVTLAFTNKINDALNRIIAKVNILSSNETSYINTCILLLNLQSALCPDSLIPLNSKKTIYNTSLGLPFNLKAELDFFLNKISGVPGEAITKTASKAIGLHISKREPEILSLMESVSAIIRAFEEGENSILKKYNFNISNPHDKYLLMLRLIIEYSYPQLLERNRFEKINMVCSAILTIITTLETASPEDDERNAYIIKNIADNDYISKLIPDNDIKLKKETKKTLPAPVSFYNEKYLRLLLLVYAICYSTEKNMPVPNVKSDEFKKYSLSYWMSVRAKDIFWYSLKLSALYAPIITMLYFTISSVVNYLQTNIAVGNQFDTAINNLTVSCPQMTNGTVNGTWPLSDDSIDYTCHLYLDNLQLYNDTCCLGIMACLASSMLIELESACDEWFELRHYLSFYVCLVISIGVSICALLPIWGCMANEWGMRIKYSTVSEQFNFRKYIGLLISKIIDLAPDNHKPLLRQIQASLNNDRLPTSLEIKEMLQTLASVAPTEQQVVITISANERTPLLPPTAQNSLTINT